MATGDANLSWGATTTCIVGSSAIADAGFVTAGNATITEVASNVYPLGRAVLYTSFSATVSAGAGRTVDLYRRDTNIDGTNDAPIPDANNKNRYVGTFVLDADITQWLAIEVPLTTDQEFYFQNNGGNTLTNTFKLIVTPFTYKPAA